MTNSFSNFNLKPELLESLKNLKFEHMTPIQEKSLPLILKGDDIIAQAKTGSGKTAAFGLGILNKLQTSSENIQALILCPTRELAEQVTLEVRRLAASMLNVKILTLAGGVAEAVHEKALDSNPHIVVGTPGRVLKLIEKQALDLSNLNMFVLDEADRMLDMGFYDAIAEVASHIPRQTQSLLFSATYPENILKLSQNVQSNAIEIKVDTQHEDNKIIDVFYEVRSTQDKNNLLYKILSQYKPERAIVFCRTKKETTDVADFLISRKIFAKSLNGDLEQKDRTEVLTNFSNRSLSILVATDIAARGLDIKDLNAVINFNLPSGAENYIHRIGRTGRAGGTGLAFSFFNPEEDFRLKEIEELRGLPCKIEDPLSLSYSETYSLVPPMKTIYISGGKKDKLRPGDIVGALIGECKLKSEDIGDINIQPSFTFIAIKKGLAQKAIDGLSSGRIKKKKYKVGLA